MTPLFKKTTFYWVAIHVSLTLLIPVFLSLFLFSGCINQNENNNDYGPEIKINDVFSQLYTYSGYPGLLDLNKNESITIEKYVRMGETFQTLELKKLNVSEREETQTEYRIQILQNVIPIQYTTTGDIIVGKPTLSVYDETFNIARSTSWATQLDFRFFSPFNLSQSSDDSEEPLCDKLTYHNLHRKSYQKSASHLFKDKNCFGLRDCMLNLTEISYTQLCWNYSKSKPDKIIHTITVSPEIPRLASLGFFDSLFSDLLGFKSCAKGILNPEQPAVLELCQELIEMDFGNQP